MRKELRCDCGSIVATLENGALVIESRHHGERHRTVFSLATLWALAHCEGPGRVTLTAEPVDRNHRGEPLR